MGRNPERLHPTELAAGLQLERLVEIGSPYVLQVCAAPALGVMLPPGTILKQSGKVQSGCGGSSWLHI